MKVSGRFQNLILTIHYAKSLTKPVQNNIYIFTELETLKNK